MSIKEASRSCDLTGDKVLVITFIQQAKPKYKRGSIDDRNERERERESGREREQERERDEMSESEVRQVEMSRAERCEGRTRSVTRHIT